MIAEQIVPNDLIYEGITTQNPAWFLHLSENVPNDLIYEGITTRVWRSHIVFRTLVPNDLIYEGITTPPVWLDSTSVA